MKNLKIILTLIFILVIGLTASLPHIFGIFKFRNEYSPFTTNQNLSYMHEETYIYAAKVQQILKGNIIGDSYIWEYRLSPSLYTGELMAILPIVFLSLITGSVSSAFIVSDFIFPFFLALVIYLGLRKNNYDRWFSLLCCVVVTVAPFISSLLPYLFKEGTQILGAENNPLFISRTPYPQISSIYLFAMVFVTTLFIRSKKENIPYLWSFLSGLSFYLMPYVGSTVLLASALYIKGIFKKHNVGVFIKSLLIITIVSLPWILNTLQVSNTFSREDIFQRLTFPVFFLFPVQIRYALIALVLWFFKGKSELFKVLAIFIFSAAILVDGHQIILGRNLEADHFISRTLAPLSTLAILLLLQKWLKHINFKHSNILWIVTAVSILGVGLFKQIDWIREYGQQLKVDKDIYELTNNIKSNTPKNAVIGSIDPQISRYITGLTGRWVYLAPGNKTNVQTDEQLKRICDLVSIDGSSITDNSVNPLVTYGLGFQAWQKDNSLFTEGVKSCVESENNKILKFKLDYLVKKDYDGNFYLERVSLD
ncbi:MAG: hypothetical protein US31_C0008G0021 [Berkelbacteria bacterium GW2011_GWA1_36_9]|uniref:Uncharacterized protein n=1 Tax=Berkelbacteria bacterium GW2011_GWA1_36_9 TaxID=1618331 RepID=A0A0G0FGJ2_9BACT|nr:MAG: hypothetical protein US31_C0008G0021 [Berkelbacteria bacterium GW2011_GWA1_36_9]